MSASTTSRKSIAPLQPVCNRARARPGIAGEASRRVHPSHHCWRIFTCAGSCWDGRSSGSSGASALAIEAGYAELTASWRSLWLEATSPRVPWSVAAVMPLEVWVDSPKGVFQQNRPNSGHPRRELKSSEADIGPATAINSVKRPYSWPALHESLLAQMTNLNQQYLTAAPPPDGVRLGDLRGEF